MLGKTPAASIADLEEKELVRHLIQDWHWGSPIITMLGCTSGSQYLPEVDLGALGCEGDIDLLCASPTAPHEAVAVSFKVAKVVEDTYYTIRPGKLNKLPKLYRQTNTLVQLGFNRVYACLVVLIDGRSTPENQTVIGGLTEELRTEIDSRVSLSDLSHMAGLLRVDLVQDPASAPLTNGEIGCRLLRMPSRQQQSDSLTEWVAQRLSVGVA